MNSGKKPQWYEQKSPISSCHVAAGQAYFFLIVTYLFLWSPCFCADTGYRYVEIWFVLLTASKLGELLDTLWNLIDGLRNISL